MFLKATTSCVDHKEMDKLCLFFALGWQTSGMRQMCRRSQLWPMASQKCCFPVAVQRRPEVAGAPGCRARVCELGHLVKAPEATWEWLPFQTCKTYSHPYSHPRTHFTTPFASMAFGAKSPSFAFCMRAASSWLCFECFLSKPFRRALGIRQLTWRFSEIGLDPFREYTRIFCAEKTHMLTALYLDAVRQTRRQSQGGPGEEGP